MKSTEDPLVFALAKKIRDARLNKGMTQAQVADRLHVSVQTYSHYENCTRMIGVDVLFRLPEVFDVPIAALLPDAIVTRYDHYVTDRKLDELLSAWPELAENQKQALLGVLRGFISAS